MLKTTSVRVSSIQIMQIREKTTAKVFGKVDTFWTYHTSSSTRHPSARARHHEPPLRLIVVACLLSPPPFGETGASTAAGAGGVSGQGCGLMVWRLGFG